MKTFINPQIRFNQIAHCELVITTSNLSIVNDDYADDTSVLGRERNADWSNFDNN